MGHENFLQLNALAESAILRLANGEKALETGNFGAGFMPWPGEEKTGVVSRKEKLFAKSLLGAVALTGAVTALENLTHQTPSAAAAGLDYGTVDAGHEIPMVDPPRCQTYTVKPGDNLNDIGLKFHEPWQTIAADNPQIVNPRLIHPGDELRLLCDTGGPDQPIGRLEMTTLDKVFSGNDPVHEMVIRSVFDPSNKQADVPVSKLSGLTTQKANQILADYRVKIEESPDMKKLLNETAPAINLLNRVQKQVMYDVDFRDGQYHFFTPEKLRENVVFVHGETWGGGLSALIDYPGTKQNRPAKIYGPYDTLTPNQIREDAAGAIFITNYVHELYLHPLQDLADNDNIDAKESPVVHLAIGVWEDLARQQYAIGWEKVDDKLLFVMEKMEEGGMPRQTIIRNMLRIGAGVLGEIPNAENSYAKGRKPGDPTWNQLWSANYKSVLKDDDAKLLVNKFRQEADKMFGVPFTAY